MPDEKVDSLAAAAAEDELLPEGDAPFKTAEKDEESSEDLIADAVDKGDKETSDDKKSEASDAEAKPSDADEKKDDNEDEVKQILKKTETKDNVQRRIDQLTARLKNLEEENSRLKSQPLSDSKKEPVYTEQQLKSAMKVAIEEGDADLMFQVMDYQAKQIKKELTEKYEAAEKAKVESSQKVQLEWTKVVNDYAKAWEDDKGVEIYPNAQRELNIKNQESLLFKVAYDLYNTQDEQGNYIYRVPGGQRMAVADALAAILKQKKLQPQSGKVKKLERSLAKEKIKKSLSGSESTEEVETSKKIPSTADTLAEVIDERKQYQAERGL